MIDYSSPEFDRAGVSSNVFTIATMEADVD